MSNDLPFLKLSQQAKLLPASQVISKHFDDEPQEEQMPDDVREAWSETSRLFRASVKGVQTSFKHISIEDIAHPPQGWMDAMLARQIAMHIAIRRLHAPMGAVVRDLQRGRNNVRNALQSVENRMVSEDFATAYEDMAKVAERNLDDGDVK